MFIIFVFPYIKIGKLYMVIVIKNAETGSNNTSKSEKLSFGSYRLATALLENINSKTPR